LAPRRSRFAPRQSQVGTKTESKPNKHQGRARLPRRQSKSQISTKAEPKQISTASCLAIFKNASPTLSENNFCPPLFKRSGRGRTHGRTNYLYAELHLNKYSLSFNRSCYIFFGWNKKSCSPFKKSVKTQRVLVQVKSRMRPSLTQ
jgi:hypothetical protein